jgi:predicted enzyme involved in methoxymalonyl-ACP biosynthesis
MLHDASRETFVLTCSDRFGNYGIVGFAVVLRQQRRLVDLMFSCRIQGKRVEHAFLVYLLRRFGVGRGGDFSVSFRPTRKNAASSRVFADVGFETGGESEGVVSMVFRSGWDIPDEGIITFEEPAGERG